MKNLYAQAASGLAFIVPEILSIDEEKLKGFLNEKEELKLYEHALEEINLQRPHVLPAEQEALLAEASEAMGAAENTFGMLNNADLEFPSIKDENGVEVEVTHGRFTTFLESAIQEFVVMHLKQFMKPMENFEYIFKHFKWECKEG